MPGEETKLRDNFGGNNGYFSQWKFGLLVVSLTRTFSSKNSLFNAYRS